MRLLSVERSATVAWSPLSQQPSLMAVGTVAGTLGIDFDTSAYLEIVSLDLMGGKSQVLGKTSVNDRFSKLVWGLAGTQNQSLPKGVIAGGLANGTVVLWDAAKLASGEDSLIASCERHTLGPVQGLDFNPYQHNLLASGAGDSEIFIWDLQNPATPTVYNPGTKIAQHGQDNAIMAVQWNKKVQHILGSTNQNGVTVIWDLKAKRAVLNFSDPNRKLRCRSMAWNPEEATQLVTASEDDSAPVIQVWDLRNSHQPIKTLGGHTAGIWGISWCPMDNDLLLSSSRDNKTLCWNMKSGEILCEVDIDSQQWNFDVQWSPRIPAILSTTSFEGEVRVHSLQDVRGESSSGLGIAAKATASHPPKWLKRPAGATFGFGGKIVYFKKQKTQTDPKKVVVAQVVTDKELVDRADKLESALANGNLKEYCDQKVSTATNPQDKAVWEVLKVLMEETQRTHILRYLGYDNESIQQDLAKFAAKFPSLEPVEEKPEPVVEPAAPAESETEGAPANEDEAVFEKLAKTKISEPEAGKPKKVATPIRFDFEGEEGVITKALLVGDFPAAVDCCVRTGRMADALVLAAYGGPALYNKTQDIYFRQQPKPFVKIISSIVKNELRDLVENTDLSQWKAALAILCTYAKKEDFAMLCDILGDRLADGNDTKSAILVYICAGDLEKAVKIWAPAGIENHNNEALLDLIEKTSTFRKAINYREPLAPVLQKGYSEYAELLASQGRISSAMKCLSFLNDAKVDETNENSFFLLDRLYHSQKLNTPAPPFPYKRQEVAPAAAVAPVKQAVPIKQTAVPVKQAAHTPFQTPFPTYQPPQQHHPHTPHQPMVPIQPIQHVNHPSGAHGHHPGHHAAHAPLHAAPAGPVATSVPTFGHAAHAPLNPQPTVPTVPTVPVSMPGLPSAPRHVATNLSPRAVQQPNAVPQYPPLQPQVTQPLQVQPKPVQTTVAANTTLPPFTPPVVSPPAPSAVVSSSSGESRPAAAPAPVAPPAPVATSPENQFIIDSLKSILEACSTSTDPKVSKLVKDVQKRCEPMIERLSKNDFSPNVTQNLSQLCQAIQSRNHQSAQQIQINLTQNNWEELGSNLMIAVKRLVEINK
eukprot:TRINITY_DN1672_c0_g2_i1.p1 TRINITY_DN1672_c0_g2~~TRINITY_DN1672_c0_g2_i1.p1  ORF type:complete len:1099 (+),score=314.97 TRINITY_DN1672_c0_g2_i1:121-3417(+)